MGKITSYPIVFKNVSSSELKFPFGTPLEAETVYNVLRVDPEPKRNFVTKQLNLDASTNTVTVKFTGDTAKNIRTAITSFFEGYLLCVDTIKQFGPKNDDL